MTTTLKCEIKDNRNLGTRYPLNGNTSTTAVRTFIVLSDDPADTPDIVLATAGLPARHELYPGVPTARMIGIEASQDSNAWPVWTVKCDYSSFDTSQSGGGGGEPENPTQRTPVAEMGFRLFQAPVTERLRDAQGNLTSIDVGIRNSADEPFDPVVTADAHRPVFRVTSNVANANLATYASYIDGVNDAPYTWGPYTFQTRTLKIQDCTVSRQMTENGVSYRQIAWQVEWKEERWDIQIVDRGTYYYDYDLPAEDDSPAKVSFVSKTGHKYNGLLRGKAGQNGAGNPPNDGMKWRKDKGDGGPDPLGVLGIRYYKELDFTTLPLPPLP